MREHSILLLGVKDPSLALSHFGGAGHRVAHAPAAPSAWDGAGVPDFDIVYLQPAEDARAIEELRHALGRRPDLRIVLVCSRPSAPMVLDAWRSGAADILFQPLTPESLNESLQRAERHTPGRHDFEETEKQARFRCPDETGKDRWITITPPRFTIGRSSVNSLVLAANRNVSRSHAEVLVENGNYTLRDLGSRHGTFVNGVQVAEAVLHHGDRIRLGGLQGESLTFHQGDLLQSLLSISGSGEDSGLSVHGFRQMGMLLSAFNALSSIPLLDDLLNLVVDTAIEMTGADRGLIMLKEADGNLHFRSVRDANGQSLDGAPLQFSHRVPEEVFQTGRRIVIRDLDVSEIAEDHNSTRRLGVRSICCVPLRYLPFRDSSAVSVIGAIENIGVLYLDSTNIGGGLSPGQIDALDTLASEAAMAIYNARLYKESQAKRKLDEELAIAREIQQSLLPSADKTLAFVTGCSVNIPCREVGGDYSDYFDMEGGKLGFAIGDVSGKGMPAALLAAMLQGIFCAQTLLNLPLPSMIANVNCSLARRSTGSRFVTFFFGILDPEGNLTYTNAGHNPPLLFRADGSLHELTRGGMVLGLFPQAQYESDTVHLDPGDHLVLFTDGLLEALNPAGEEFGEVRLHEVLQTNAGASAGILLRRLQEQVACFSAGAPQHDDITLMVLGYREPAR